MNVRSWLSLALVSLLVAPAPAQTAGKLDIVVIEGEGAINNLKQGLTREPIVEVRDENDKPVGGALVTFTLPGNGAGGAFGGGAQTLTVTTDAQGRAVASGFRPNSHSGSFKMRVRAQSQGRTAAKEIAMKNVASAAGAGGMSTGLIITIVAAAATAAAVGVAVGTRNNGPAGPSPTVIQPGGGTVGGR